jgi:hypothetical protein
MDERIGKLPKWAQHYIQELSDENLSLKTKIAAMEAAVQRERVDPDVPVPQDKGITKGYVPVFVGESHRPYFVQYGWSRSYGHKTTRFLPKTAEEEIPDRGGWCQEGKPLFSTKERALRSLQYHAFQHYLAIMEKIAKDLESI